MTTTKLRAKISNDFMSTVIIAFLAIFAIPMVCSLIVLHYNESNVKSEIINSDKVVINTISGYLDKEVSSVETIANSVTKSDFYKKVSSYPEINLKDGNYVADIYNLAKELKGFVGAYPSVEDMYIFYNDAQLVVSASSFDEAEDFFKKYYLNADIEYSQWKQMLDANLYQSFKVVKDASGEYIDFFIDPFYFAASGNLSIKIAVRLSTKQISEYISKIYAFKQKQLIVISKDDAVVFTTGEQLLPQMTYGQISDFADFRELDDCMYTSLKSANTGWKYVLCTGNSFVADKIQYIRYVVIINIIVYLLMAILFIVMFIIKNYLPVKKLVHMVKGGNTVNYSFLETVVSEYNTYKMYTDRYKKRFDEIQKNKFFNSLVSVERTGNTLFKEAKSLGVNFISDKFVLLLMDVYNFEAMFAGENIDDAERMESAEFIIKNIFEELFLKIGHGYVFPKNDRFVCVLNLNEDIHNWKDDTRQLIQLGKSIIEKQFDIFMTVNVTDMYCGAQNVFKAYTDAFELYKKTRFFKNAEIVFFDEVSQKGTVKVLDNKFADRLTYFVQGGNKTAAIELVNNILTSYTGNLSEKNNSFKIYTIKIIDTLSSMLSDDDLLRAEFFECVNKILEFESYSSCISGFERLIACVTDCVTGSDADCEDEIDSSRMVKKIKDFVAEVYGDSNITVAYIGESIGVTPYYASRVFKEETGENLSDYISRYRIEKAKEILDAGENVSVSKLYQMVGFGSERTFMRMFAKYENITISQYKKILKSDN